MSSANLATPTASCQSMSNPWRVVVALMATLSHSKGFGFSSPVDRALRLPE